MPPNPAITGWKVTGQLEEMGQDDTGRPVRGMRVSFQTRDGVQSSIFVPQTRYTPDNVKAALLAAVSSIDQVHRLGG